MKNFPQPGWAVILAGLGVVVALVVYCYPGDVTSKQAGFQVASALVTGALGAFAGRAEGSSIVQSGPNATVTPTVPVTDPKA